MERRFGPLYSVSFNGQILKPPTGAPYRLIQGEAYARVCSLTDAGIKTYNNEFKYVTMTVDGVDWKWPLGARELEVGGTRFATKLAPVRVGDEVFYPVRDLAERLGYRVSWADGVLYLRSQMAVHSLAAVFRTESPIKLHTSRSQFDTALGFAKHSHDQIPTAFT